MSKEQLKAVDFFSGAGGMSCGFRQAGIAVLGGIDIDPTVENTYLKNHPDSFFLNADINRLRPEELEIDYGIKRKDKSMVFIACSPCQHWTVLHTRKKSSIKSRNLLGRFSEFVNYFQPGYIVIENVPGILNNPNQSGLSVFNKILDEFGYYRSSSIINTSNFGIPQSRKRFVLIASKKNITLNLMNEDVGEIPTVRQFIGPQTNLKKLRAGERDSKDVLHRCANLEKINITRLQKTPKNGGTRLSWKDDAELQLKTYQGRDKVFATTYGRMSWDSPAPTITTKFFSISNGRFAHPEQDRAISLREGALLQTFPMNYQFISNSIGDIARQIGNAVPPKLAKRLAAEIKRIHNL